MQKLKVALVGAGSRSFGPSTVNDVLISDVLAERGVHLALMDISEKAVSEVEDYAKWAAAELGRDTEITRTTDLDCALDGADFVVDAIEISRDVYWAMDFHIPRKHGFKQIYGENGGPGSHFHALRNMKPIVQIAQAMERHCPGALLLNYTNPMHKLCQAATRLSKTSTIGLCHGVWMGMDQVCHLLGMEMQDLDARACGINHFTWFQSLRDKRTGEDLYPRLREVEAAADPLYDWHEIALSRVLFRRYGLYPSPGANHIGEYLGWADEFFASNLHWYYDPASGHPWQTGIAPEFVYTVGATSTHRPIVKPAPEHQGVPRGEIRFSGELAQPIMEAIGCGVERELDAINVPNLGAIPNLPDDLVVEVPARADGSGWRREVMDPLPEGIAAYMRTQASIMDLLVEAYVEGSKEKLIQALLLEPMVDSYRRTVEMVDEMLALQRDLLPELA